MRPRRLCLAHSFSHTVCSTRAVFLARYSLFTARSFSFERYPHSFCVLVLNISSHIWSSSLAFPLSLALLFLAGTASLGRCFSSSKSLSFLLSRALCARSSLSLCWTTHLIVHGRILFPYTSLARSTPLTFFLYLARSFALSNSERFQWWVGFGSHLVPYLLLSIWFQICFHFF